MPKHSTRGLIRALSTLLKLARARWMSALALYLAKPVDEFSMLTTADQQALATVPRRGDVLLSAGSTRCAELVKRLTQSRWSHVSMYVGALEYASDPLCVVEAHIVGGVRAVRLSELDARRICVLRPVGLDDTDRSRLAESVLRKVGSEYDFVHVVGAAAFGSHDDGTEPNALHLLDPDRTGFRADRSFHHSSGRDRERPGSASTFARAGRFRACIGFRDRVAGECAPRADLVSNLGRFPQISRNADV